MKIVDAFTFYNELDMLYYRLSVLYDIVDHFIIVEATKTHVGKSKPLYYQENRERFAKFADKIIHVIDDGLITDVSDAWCNENHQRNHIQEGIKQLDLIPSDMIIISDVDEIPDVNSLVELKKMRPRFGLLCLEQDFYYYNLTCKNATPWYHAKIVSYGAYVDRFQKQAQKCRLGFGLAEGVIKPGGWHLSYFGNSEFIRNKLEHFAHQEFNSETYKSVENIENQIKSGGDLFRRTDQKFHKIPIGENRYLPPKYELYLQDFMGQII